MNPRAGSGAAKRQTPHIRRLLEEAGLAYDLFETNVPGDATRLMRNAIADRVSCVVVAGGDGTLNEVVQGFLDPNGQVMSGPELALVPIGTGGDFRRTLGLEQSVQQAIKRLTGTRRQSIDLGIANITTFQDKIETFAFLNILSFGLGGATDHLVNASPKWLGGKMTFLIGALRALATYRNQPVKLHVDGVLVYEGPMVNVALANGRYFGGGMHVAPNADPSDGLLDVIVIGDLPKTQAPGLMRQMYRGAHIGRPGVQQFRGKQVEATPFRPHEKILVDLDGETPGSLPLRARLTQHAITLRI